MVGQFDPAGEIPLRGEIWWADLPEPRGHAPGYRRPVVIVQSDYFNTSTRLTTTVVIPVTSNVRWVRLPGVVELPARETKLSKVSFALTHQIITVDREELIERISKLHEDRIRNLEEAMRVVLALR